MARTITAKNLTANLFLICLISFPRSFLFLKLIFLFFFLFTCTLDIATRRPLVIYARILLFYAMVSIAGITWSLIGIFHGSPSIAIQGSLRLWIIWSLAYALVFTFLRNLHGSIRAIHLAIVISGILISLLNFAGLFDSYAMTGIFGEELRNELMMNIGFHDGYIQITSHNIGSLFFIVPYLLVIQVRRDARYLNGWPTRISLLLTLLLAALSGRRALWLCIILTPSLILVLSWLSSSFQHLKRNQKTLLLVSSLFIFILVPLVVVIGQGFDNATLDHLLAAFSAEDERSIQLGYLIDGFRGYPLFGTGFGAILPYIRSYEEPWLYELTYFQLLLNLGLVGMLGFLGVFGFFNTLIIKLIRRHPEATVVPFALLIGLFAFLIGCYSNPYLGSFDFLLYLGMVPFLSSFKKGFTDDASHSNSNLNGLPRHGNKYEI